LPFPSTTLFRSEARGMFRQDGGGNPTRRFGGIEFVPASILVRGFGEKGTHVSAVADNEARYNDFVPLVYGTAWHSPLIVFARNDGNLTHLEVLLYGMKLPVYGEDGALTGVQLSSNPAWVLMDVLRRSGWSLAELDVSSFATAASYCDEQINTQDLFGNATTVARFQCNLVVSK